MTQRPPKEETNVGFTFLITRVVFLCACRRERRHTEEDLHEVGEQAFEKGETTASRINGLFFFFFHASFITGGVRVSARLALFTLFTQPDGIDGRGY